MKREKTCKNDERTKMRRLGRTHINKILLAAGLSASERFCRWGKPHMRIAQPSTDNTGGPHKRQANISGQEYVLLGLGFILPIFRGYIHFPRFKKLIRKFYEKSIFDGVRNGQNFAA